MPKEPKSPKTYEHFGEALAAAIVSVHESEEMPEVEMAAAEFLQLVEDANR